AVFGGVLRMPESPSLADARDAILAAASAHGGGDASLLSAAFDEHGIPSAGGATASEPPGANGQEVAFTSPRKRSYVVHVGESVSVPIEATSASGAKVTLAASALARAHLTKHAGDPATGTLVYAPTEADRGRQSVTLRASAGGDEATLPLTFVVRGS